ncbi:hypothetical protein LENED_000954 [Lentinula edodes]|uniref:G-protein coupled receptors family 3 profile domain-containing protein n=1 Tax=Lentinula edodes TaxID=5353 RepID=A0A1Q3DWW4_LENED|nr:hypothetical protein LENED_000954 [Lentinula edodes]
MALPADTGPAMPMNIVHGTHAELILFLVLNMWPSHFGLPILLAIVLLSKRVQRHPTFVNLLIVFMVVGISSSLLVYAGNASGPEPSPALCLAQAALLYGMPGITSVAVFALVFQVALGPYFRILLTQKFQMFIVIRAAFYKQPSRDTHFVRIWVMIIAPYAVWIVFIVVTVFVGVGEPANVSRDRRFFYCSVKSDALTGTLTIFAAVVLLATLILEAWTIVLFYKRWVSIARGSSGMFTAAELNLPLLILAFGMYLLVAMSLSLLSMKSPESPIPDLIIASAATVVILIFGTQLDILRAICFWRKEVSIGDTSNDSTNDSEVYKRTTY